MGRFWVNELNPPEARAMVLIHGYEDVRREFGQYGYKAFRRLDINALGTPLFKQFKTVSEWLCSKGWPPSYGEHHWLGYIRYVFKNMKPSVPQPGMLKNNYYLARYISSCPKVVARKRTKEDLEELYKSVVRPELRGDRTLDMLGLKARWFTQDD